MWYLTGRFTICAVPALRNFGVSSISCGAAHTAVLTKVWIMEERDSDREKQLWINLYLSILANIISNNVLFRGNRLI